MGRAGCAHAALLLTRLRFTRLVRVAPRRFCLLPPSREPNICSPRRLGCPSCASRRSLVPRDPNICSPHRLSCPSRSSCARLCRRVTRTSVLPVALVASLAPHAHSPAGLLAHAARRPPADHRRARPSAEHCLGLGLRRGGYVSGLLVAKNEGGGFLLQRKSVV